MLAQGNSFQDLFLLAELCCLGIHLGTGGYWGALKFLGFRRFLLSKGFYEFTKRAGAYKLLPCFSTDARRRSSSYLGHNSACFQQEALQGRNFQGTPSLDVKDASWEPRSIGGYYPPILRKFLSLISYPAQEYLGLISFPIFSSQEQEFLPMTRITCFLGLLGQEGYECLGIPHGLMGILGTKQIPLKRSYPRSQEPRNQKLQVPKKMEVPRNSQDGELGSMNQQGHPPKHYLASHAYRCQSSR